MQIWLDLPEKMGDLLARAEAAGVTFVKGTDFFADGSGTKSLRLAFSFVSPEAQFTPKQVETKSEREKLMFRVKIQVPKEVASQYVQQIKTGVRGIGYVKVKSDAVWPARLNNLANPTAVGLLTE